MKKTFKMLAAAFVAFAAVSCAKEVSEQVSEPGESLSNLVITASFPETKVAFCETASHGLKGSWEVDDEILAIVEDSESPISFKVTAVNAETGVATLSTTASLSEGTKVYGIYCPGAQTSDIQGHALPVDLSFQQADKVPALMVATASVSGSALNFAFTNCLCIIGIVDPVINVKMDDRTMTRVIASGHEIVSSGKVVVEDGAAVFKPGSPDKFIAKSVVGRAIVEREDDNTKGTFADHVYIAVPASKVEKITMLDSKNYIRAYEVNKTAVAGKYARIYQREFTMITTPTAALTDDTTVWADKNLGAETASKSSTNTWGDLYRWSDTKLIYTVRTQNSVTFDDDHASGYVAPSSGELYYTTTYQKYTSADKKNVLDPVDDPVQIAYPGTGWRMPTVEEFNHLNARTDMSFATSGWVKFIDSESSETLLYIPRTYVSNKGTAFALKGRYWTSSIDLSGNKPTFFEIGTSAMTTGTQYRYYGLSIRPVRTSKSK